MTQPTPPQPRKQPQQTRSQRMVQAILDACQKILQEYGETALTLPLLETVSGVGKGSIYQYFPNLEAIVAGLYQRECRRTINATVLTPPDTDDLPLEHHLRRLIRQSVASHRQLRQLHSSFHQRYSAHFDIHEMVGEDYGMDNYIADHFIPRILRHFPAAAAVSPGQLATFALFSLQAIRSQFFTALEFQPDTIFEPAFEDYLIELGFWVLQRQLAAIPPQPAD